MLNRLVLISYSLFLILSITIVVFNFRGDISFGYGLGDLRSLLILAVLNLVVIPLYLIVRRKSTGREIRYWFIIGLVIIMVIACLKISVFRGPEFPWNGSIWLGSA
jgi:hypothetical protein